MVLLIGSSLVPSRGASSICLATGLMSSSEDSSSMSADTMSYSATISAYVRDKSGNWHLACSAEWYKPEWQVSKWTRAPSAQMPGSVLAEGHERQLALGLPSRMTQAKVESTPSAIVRRSVRDRRPGVAARIGLAHQHWTCLSGGRRYEQ